MPYVPLTVIVTGQPVRGPAMVLPDQYPPNPRWPADPACFVAQEPIDCAILDQGMRR